MAENFPEAVIRKHADLADAFLAVKNHLGLSNELCEHLGGLCKGHVDKTLRAGTREKRIGAGVFDIFCELFAVEFCMRPNPEAIRRMQARWEGKNKHQVRVHTHAMSSAQIECAKSIIFKQIADRLSLHRQKIPRAKRSRIARHAIRARWKKSRNGANGHAARR
jgi:hypothetical protein